MPRSKGAVNRHPPKTIYADAIATKPPQCRVFACILDNKIGIRQDCCFYCRQRDHCIDPCQNHPEKCGLLVIPEPKEGESNATNDNGVQG